MTGVFLAFLNGKYLKRVNSNAVVYAASLVCKGYTKNNGSCALFKQWFSSIKISCMTGLHTSSMPWWVSKPIHFMTGVFPAFLNGKYLKYINSNAVGYATYIVCRGCTQKQRHLHLIHSMTRIYGNQLHYRLLHCNNCSIDILTATNIITASTIDGMKGVHTA